jgi:hypothetical protein
MIRNIRGPVRFFGTSASTGLSGWFPIDPASESYNMIRIERTLWCNRMYCNDIRLKDTFTGNTLSGLGQENAIIMCDNNRSAFAQSSTGVLYNLENLPNYYWSSPDSRWLPDVNRNYYQDTTSGSRKSNHLIVWEWFMRN